MKCPVCGSKVTKLPDNKHCVHVYTGDGEEFNYADAYKCTDTSCEQVFYIEQQEKQNETENKPRNN